MDRNGEVFLLPWLVQKVRYSKNNVFSFHLFTYSLKMPVCLGIYSRDSEFNINPTYPFPLIT